MKDEIKEYAEAIEENLNATKNEMMAKEKKKQAHYRLLRAKEEMSAKEREILDS